MMDKHKVIIKNACLSDIRYFQQEDPILFTFFSKAILNGNSSVQDKAHLYLGIYYYLHKPPNRNIELSIEHLEKSVLSDDESIRNEASLYLERCYFFSASHRDFDKAKLYFYQARLSKQNYIKDAAFFYCGVYCYLICFGKGIEKASISIDKHAAKTLALKYLSEAALSKDVWIRDRANFYIAECYYALSEDINSFNKAFCYFKKVFGSRDVWVRDRASYYLGVCYYEGYGVDANKHKALICFEIAAMSHTAGIEKSAKEYIREIKANKDESDGNGQGAENVSNVHQCVIL